MPHSPQCLWRGARWWRGLRPQLVSQLLAGGGGHRGHGSTHSGAGSRAKVLGGTSSVLGKCRFSLLSSIWHCSESCEEAKVGSGDQLGDSYLRVSFTSSKEQSPPEGKCGVAKDPSQSAQPRFLSEHQW